jgi:hypothetical protein
MSIGRGKRITAISPKAAIEELERFAKKVEDEEESITRITDFS